MRSFSPKKNNRFEPIPVILSIFCWAGTSLLAFYSVFLSASHSPNLSDLIWVIWLFFFAILLIYFSRLSPQLKQYSQQNIQKLMEVNTELNTVITELRLMESALKSSKEELEFRVKERTAQLETKNDQLNIEIRDRERTELALMQAKETAEAATHAKSEFLATISHEIRTPMNVILSITELIEETPLSAQQIEYVRYLKKSGAILIDLINDILDLSQIEAGTLGVEERSFNLSELIEDLVIRFQPQVDEKSLKLEFFISEKIPMILQGDSVRLEQVLGHLIGNAIKFTEIGCLEVAVTTDNEKIGMFEFAVKDTGIGIPRNQWQNIFDTFTQSDSTTTRRYGGTGLGLTLCKRLVEMCGGRIWLESEEGGGSTFYFTMKFNRYP